MTLARSDLAVLALVCTACLWWSGALVAWSWGSASRWRERVCRASMVSTTGQLEVDGDALEVARSRVEWVDGVLAAERGRCSWWTRACR